MYAVHINDDRPRVSISRVADSLEKWKRRTAFLRRSIGGLDNRYDDAGTEHDDPEVLFKADILTSLADVLHNAEVVADKYLNELHNKQSFYERDSDVWYTWAALIRNICRDAQLPTFRKRKPKPAATKGKKEKGRRTPSPILHEGYLILLKELQSTLPNNKHKKRPKTHDSVRKAALNALRIGRNSKTEDLFTLLVFWSWGTVHIDKVIGHDDDLGNLIFKIEREKFGLFGRQGRYIKPFKNS